MKRIFPLLSNEATLVRNNSLLPSNKKILIVGLGNYTHPKSRHSVGQYLLDEMAREKSVHLSYKKSWKAYATSFFYKDVEVFLLKPKHYMNNNGKSVVRALSFLQISPSNLLLLHDELDLPIGKFKIKHGGSANGHYGVLDTQERIEDSNFKRMRIGIGRPESKKDVPSFVLENFTHTEAEQLEKLKAGMFELINHTISSMITFSEVNSQKES